MSGDLAQEGERQSLIRFADIAVFGARGGERHSTLDEVNRRFPKIKGRTFKEHLADLPPESKVLELGPGEGVTAQGIADQFPDLQMFTLSVEHTPWFTGTTIIGGIGQMLENNWLKRHAPFNMIFSHNVFYDLPFPIRALQDTYRLLNNDGWLIVNMLQLTPSDAEKLEKELIEKKFNIVFEKVVNNINLLFF